jgi:hypothetical protein
MSSSLDVHMVMTGHSLGRNKLEHLLASGEWWVGMMLALPGLAWPPASCVLAMHVCMPRQDCSC